MGKHLVLIGGGHAHMTSLLNIDQLTSRGHQVTLISPSPHHYYSGMGPGMLGGFYDPPQVRFHVGTMAEERGANFIQDTAVKVEPRKRIIHLTSGQSISYDVASFNTGSDVKQAALVSGTDNVIPVKPVLNLYKARTTLLQEIESRQLELTVIGGGPAGVEISANLWRLLRGKPNRTTITLVAGSELLRNTPERVRTLARRSLLDKNIRLLTGVRAENIAEGIVSLSDRSRLNYDFVFLATGITPSALFRDSGLPTGADGGLLVNNFLQYNDFPELFGGGDCISLEGCPLAKVGVYAVRQNPVLFHNLVAKLEDTPLRSFDPGPPYMLILNMGDSRGILWKRSLTLNGRLSFLLKDYIDRRFMKRYQVSGELKYPSQEAQTG
ncbi:MAG: pyridine nucleotide-disulfide oxidoreductase [Deltaproteobacteria bacterium]|nr:pyridine nucleotide-disulfide oxidoreductase [Deltaproteobacteria bacterium]TLN03624.1 MAG: pyridine nucleotide-disulfide oxidoreductase [bacterium]